MSATDRPSGTDGKTGTWDPDPSAGIAEQAADRLLHHPYHALRNVSCEFHEGVLTLRGRLPSYYLKQMAQTAVAHLDGVQQVVNRIEVRPEGRRRAGRP